MSALKNVFLVLILTSNLVIASEPPLRPGEMSPAELEAHYKTERFKHRQSCEDLTAPLRKKIKALEKQVATLKRNKNEASSTTPQVNGSSAKGSLPTGEVPAILTGDSAVQKQAN